MGRAFNILILLILSVCANAQNRYPFNNTSSSDDSRIDNLLSLMSLDEKLDMLGGAGVERLGIESARCREAIHGLVHGGLGWQQSYGMEIPTSVFPQAYGLAETWDVNLVTKVGEEISYEARYIYQQKNSNNNGGLILWAPNADMGRDPRWGRTEECYGEDPYLTGCMTAAMVNGIQGDDSKYWRCAALLKHFIANSNECNRATTSSDFGEKLFYEYYSYPFMKGFTQGGGKSYMTAYNLYNGTPCVILPELNNVLNKKWKANGIVITDAGALHNLVDVQHRFISYEQAVDACLKAGINYFLGDYRNDVMNALKQRIITEQQLNNVLSGHIRVLLKLGLLDGVRKASNNPYISIGLDKEKAPWEKMEVQSFVRHVADKSIVLLKNDNNTLPIDRHKVKKIAVIGSKADSVYADWYGGKPPYTVSPLEGIKSAVQNLPIEVRFTPNDNCSEAQHLAKWADLVIVCEGNNPVMSPDWLMTAPWGKGVVASEGREEIDRKSLMLENEDLVKVVYKQNKNVVLALISSFPYAIEWSAENVPAIIHCTQSCQELGNALADVLFGDYNPAGRTVQTWVRSIDDLPEMMDYDITHGRTYMYSKTQPLFPFGYGLSYTNFNYTNFNVSYERHTFIVTFDVENFGSMVGEDVPQIYVSYDNEPGVKHLKAFKRINFAVGEKKTVRFDIPAEDIVQWDEFSHSWKYVLNNIKFMLGASSEDIKQEYTYTQP